MVGRGAWGGGGREQEGGSQRTGPPGTDGTWKGMGGNGLWGRGTVEDFDELWKLRRQIKIK